MTASGSLAINRERLHRRIDELAQIGKLGDTGVCRLALSEEDLQGVRLVKRWMEEAGLQARIDAFGNLFGRLEGRDPGKPLLMAGSHIDSQPYGGRFDGVIGVLGALEAVQTLTEQGVIPEMPIEIAAFCDEEGCRFNKGLFGVRGITGKLEDGELERTDAAGVTRREALVQFGGDPNGFEAARYREGAVGAFLELHIEQGPVLEAMGHPIGIVSGISGPLWLTVEMTGFAGHAGSVPMPMRRDALVGAASVITALNALARSEPGAPTVGTVGALTVFPNSRNIIPEKVTFTIDLRDIDMERRRARESQLWRILEETASEHGLTYTVREDTNSEARYCAERIKQVMHAEAAQLLAYTPPELMSGPFHDSLAMSHVCDYGMIFVRCKDGISHNPLEYSTPEDIELGVELLYRTIVRMSSVDGEERGG
ncbi:M20 family metallo-hydrolase [Paenibacillus sp. CF384]|uniref:M20 family metallo-hydrolase n=1 Tax=Paenibacillus sp. CF384 TaxID=1884382 RepID=UPI00089C59C4|nr:M20 family metallo-hydrolase [Paenibacillus sp. CF384]SDW57178.1 allantoate deiminase/N-carbamoyl-L-amino-acid hydrolase [Paenibacillus sp. CF384]